MKIIRPALSPLLFLLYILIFPYYHNYNGLYFDQPIRSSLVLLLALILLLLVLKVLFHDWRRACFQSFLALLYWFVFGHILILVETFSNSQIGVVPSVLLIGSWTGAFILLSSNLVWRFLSKFGKIDLFLTVVIALSLYSPVKFLAPNIIKDYILSPDNPPAISLQPGDQARMPSVPPDIYILVLDGYGSQEVLSSLYGFDNSQFIGQLEKRGFYIAPDSRSNYPMTALSIASLLNYDYVADDEFYFNIPTYNKYTKTLIDENRLFTNLMNIGYQTISIKTGYYITEIANADQHHSQTAVMNAYEKLLVSATPLVLINRYFPLALPIRDYPTHINRIFYAFDVLANLPDLQGPRIVFAHILAPHPPFIFSPDGSIQIPSRPFETFDANEFKGTRSEYMEGYTDQVAFINQLIIRTIDRIIQNSNTPPILVILGDHGPASQFSWDPEQPGCVWERTSNLVAILTPSPGPDTLYPTISPVNIFRILLNQFFDTNYPILQDRSYYTTHININLLQDITQERDERVNCTFSR